MNRYVRSYLAWGLVLLAGATFPVAAADPAPQPAELFARENLVAWCIVPFDARKRGPEARAEMLTRMGIHQLAYDWRAEHIPTFDEELDTLKRWGIRLRAFWFPAALNEEAKAILAVLERHAVKTELWVSMGGGDIVCTPEEQQQRVAEHVAALRPIAEAAAKIGCTVGLYNHGSWFGEPENQIAILKALDLPNVGIVYNLHHGHRHVERLPALLAAMKPYLYCINVNGMTREGETNGQKILSLGMGELDLGLLRTIRDSGYQGPIGILGHTMDDVEEVLRDNLDGLDWLVPQLDGAPPAGPRPPLRVGRAAEAQGTQSLSEAFGTALAGGILAEGDAAFSAPPITVELRARLTGRANFNILVANETKASGTHWEIFTEPATGHLSVFTPGLTPDHLRSGRDVCDQQWHQITLHYARDHLALYVDGDPVGSQAVQPTGQAAIPGALGIGRLVEGALFSEGAIDDVRISSGLRPPAKSDAPLQADVTTLRLFHFDDLDTAPAGRAVAEVEDPARRAALPEFQVIPAAAPDTLTPAMPVPAAYATEWHRSHGNPHNTRYAAYTQINRENVGQLQVAWEYRSGDEPGNVQCNPIIVGDTLFTPTSGKHVVALDAATGVERWRFRPEGLPAHRGLLYWPGTEGHAPRLLFNAGSDLWALNPETGAPLDSFGKGGRVTTGEVRVAGAVFEHVLVLPTFLQDVSGYDVRTGERIWTFHTLPQGDAFGADTWSRDADSMQEGANCWGGMAMDAQRGIAYLSTGSPKPNFAGNTHRGQNLFANCVIALDARTGERRWHFQEIRHDIWDIDIPAPPNLVTVERDGKKVDAVAQVTKLGNTLLLDRVTGKPLFPVRLRRAPVSTVPGEYTWPYQPDLELPEPFARQVFDKSDITERSRTARAVVEQRIAGARYGWFQPLSENIPTVFYNVHGGAEWPGAAIDPTRGHLYVSANNMPWIVTLFQPDPDTRDPDAPPTLGATTYQTHCMACHGPDRFGVGMNPPLQGLARRMDDAAVRALLATGRNAMPAAPESLTDIELDALLDFLFLRDQPAPNGAAAPAPLRYTHNGYPKLLDDEGYPGVKPPWGTLNCLDLNTGKLLWQVPLGTYPDLAAWGEDDTGAENFGGPAVTAGGLVFCAGTPDEMIRAFDAATGAVLWEHALPYGGYAPPAIYETGGRQFVVIPATGGGKLGTTAGDALVAFALPT